MRRTFVFAFQPCYGETGGGQGVVFRLYSANKKYGIFEDIHFVFGDRAIDNNEDIGELAKKTHDSSDTSSLGGFLKAHCPGPLLVFGKMLKDRNYGKYLKLIANKYNFSEEDVYIFHDMQFCAKFVELFPFSRILFVNHSQGSVYNEWSAKRGRKSKSVKSYYNNQFEMIASRAKFIGFPSRGAYTSLLESEPNFKKIIPDEKLKILYNGVDCSISEEYRVENRDIESAIESNCKYKISTVAMLNEAKAIELIPEYLSDLKIKGVDFLWILVGNGVNEEKVKQAIIDGNIEDRVVWIKDYVKHDDILKLLLYTDFYMIFHRYSIFDLSTLEAMHFGNIPILTPVGGNLEVILRGNGIFVEDTKDASELVTLITHQGDTISQMKLLNKSIQNELFDEKAFAKRYKALIDVM